MKTKISLLLAMIITLSFACKTKTPPPGEVATPVVQSVEFKKMITAKVFIQPGKENEFISAARMMIEKSNEEEGCLGYMLYQDPYESTNFIFVETYKNQAAVDAHFATTYFKEFGTLIEDMTSKPTEIKIYEIAGEQ